MIDSQSDHSYILESIRKDLNVSGPFYNYINFNHDICQRSGSEHKVLGLLVRGFNNQE